jgi:hypothetical protein
MVQVIAADTPQQPTSSVPDPYPLLNPPPGITPEKTRGGFPLSYDTANTHLAGRPKVGKPLPQPSWTPESRLAYEKRIQWFHDAKFGVMFHFLPRMMRGPKKEIGEAWAQWDDAKWNAQVDAVDVEKFAEKAKELGVGYVILSIGQGHGHFCAPNPVIEAAWKLQPGQGSSKRDLPMDLGKALAKRGIPIMFYTSTDMPMYGLAAPEGMPPEERFRQEIKALEWYSDHYGALCKGWWLDGLTEHIPGYREDVTKAVRHGNPDALVTSGSYEISDFLHGHCTPTNWNKQRTLSRPFYGRWDPKLQIQWHAFLTVGSTWGSSDTPKNNGQLVDYASDVVRGGGVITFDVGVFPRGGKGPVLDFPPAQFEQLKKVRDALKDIKPSDGSGR